VTDSGETYAGRQTNIRGNHIALVNKGRAGPECKLLAKSDAFSIESEKTMKTKKIKIGDQEFSVPAMVADAIEANNTKITIGDNEVLVPKVVADEITKLTKSHSKSEIKADEDMPDDEEESEEGEDSATGIADSSKSIEATLRARIDALEAANKKRESKEAARIDARVNLVTETRSILGNVRTDGVSDLDLMVMVIDTVLPDLKDKTAANRKDSGYIRALFEQAVSHHRKAQDSEIESNKVLFDSISSEKNEHFDADSAYIAYIEKLSNAHKRAEA